MGLREELTRRLRGRVALVGVGNALWGDDGAGPALIQRLEGKIPALLVDGGEAPEGYWGTISAYRPETIVVIDAVDWGGAPGSVALLEAVERHGAAPSTHRISLNLFLEVLRRETGAEAFVFGIQPKALAFSAALSAEVLDSVELTAGLFADILGRGNPC